MVTLPAGANNTEGRYRLVAFATDQQQANGLRAMMVLVDPHGNPVDSFMMNSGGEGPRMQQTGSNTPLPGLRHTLNRSGVITAYNINYGDDRTRVRADGGFTLSDGRTGAQTWRLDMPSNAAEIDGAGRDGFLIHSGGRNVGTHGCFEFVDRDNPNRITREGADADALRFRATLERLQREGRAPASLELIGAQDARAAGITNARAASSPTGASPAAGQSTATPDREADEAARRNTQRDGDAAGELGSGIADAFMSFLRALLPTWLYDLIFTDNTNDLHDSERDPTPVSRSERLGNARSIVDSRALPRYEEFKRERGNSPVTHINPSGDDANQTSGFGPRNSRRTTNGNRMSSDHRGVDLVGTSEIRASADGVVLFSGRAGGYGNLVVIGHADGTETRYGHMTGSNMPRVGSTVNQRDVIGEMGATGNVTGAHLHFEIRRNGVALNPADFVAGLSRGNGGRQHAEHDHDEPRSSTQTTVRLPVMNATDGPGAVSLPRVSLGNLLRG